MVIVSQDKTIITEDLNMYVRKFAPRSNEVEYTIENDDFILARYKTEERAKEVLEEIQAVYASSEILKVPSVTPKRTVSGLELIDAFVYKMPKE